MKHKHNVYFRDNLRDWCAGGPREGGWTRTGRPIDMIDAHLVSYHRATISVDEALSKNRPEVERWHLSFLEGHPQAYFSEYLDVRYDEARANERAGTFLDLLENMRLWGFNQRYPVCVADISELDLGFRYFRFDGCHRLCCAKHLGIHEVPAYIFSISVSSKG